MTVDADTLRRHVEVLASEIGERNVFRPHGLAAAATYIEQQWRRLGYDVAAQSYEAAGVVCRNLEVVLRGQSQADETIVVGAHYDTVRGSPGADDNGSGVAALLEIGRCLVDRVTDRTIRLVAFVNEEPPFFYWGQMGSKVYADAARARGENVRVMLSLEMLGYYSDQPGSQRYPPLFRYFFPDRGDFIGFVSNFRSRRMLREAVEAFRAHSTFPVESVATFSFVPGVSWSDHLSFWRRGYRALMVTDTAFYRNHHYHTASDTPEKLDYHSLAVVTRGLAETTVALATR